MNFQSRPLQGLRRHDATVILLDFFPPIAPLDSYLPRRKRGWNALNRLGQNVEICALDQTYLIDTNIASYKNSLLLFIFIVKGEARPPDSRIGPIRPGGQITVSAENYVHSLTIADLNAEGMMRADFSMRSSENISSKNWSNYPRTVQIATNIPPLFHLIAGAWL